jgi:hypothetical protein
LNNKQKINETTTTGHVLLHNYLSSKNHEGKNVSFIDKNGKLKNVSLHDPMDPRCSYVENYSDKTKIVDGDFIGYSVISHTGKLKQESISESVMQPFTGKLLDMLQSYDANEANYIDTKNKNYLKNIRKIVVDALTMIRERDSRIKTLKDLMLKQ